MFDDSNIVLDNDIVTCSRKSAKQGVINVSTGMLENSKIIYKHLFFEFVSICIFSFGKKFKIYSGGVLFGSFEV